MSVIWTADTDDDGTGTTGTIHNAAWKSAMLTGINTGLNAPAAAIYHSTTQSINDSTHTAVSFDSESIDVDGLHSTSVNTSRVTVPTGMAGTYLLIGQVSYASNATGARITSIRYNGSTYVCSWTQATAGTGLATVCGITRWVNLNVGDYIELMAWQNSGGNLNIGDATFQYGNHLQVIRLT